MANLDDDLTPKGTPVGADTVMIFDSAEAGATLARKAKKATLSSVVALAAAAGEINTASNVGAGAKSFKTKSGVDLQFRSIVAGSAAVTVSEGTDVITVDIGNVPASKVGQSTVDNRSGNQTLALTDAGKMLASTDAGAVNYSIPDEATVNFDIGAEVSVLQKGAGQVTFDAPGAAVIRSPETLKIEKQYQVVTAKKIGSDEWLLIGGLELAP